MKITLEKVFYTTASFFFTAFGLATCGVESFCVGFLAGAASIITVAAWSEDDK